MITDQRDQAPARAEAEEEREEETMRGGAGKRRTAVWMEGHGVVVMLWW